MAARPGPDRRPVYAFFGSVFIGNHGFRGGIFFLYENFFLYEQKNKLSYGRRQQLIVSFLRFQVRQFSTSPSFFSRKTAFFGGFELQTFFLRNHGK